MSWSSWPVSCKRGLRSKKLSLTGIMNCMHSFAWDCEWLRGWLHGAISARITGMKNIVDYMDVFNAIQPGLKRLHVKIWIFSQVGFQPGLKIQPGLTELPGLKFQPGLKPNLPGLNHVNHGIHGITITGWPGWNSAWAEMAPCNHPLNRFQRNQGRLFEKRLA